MNSTHAVAIISIVLLALPFAAAAQDLGTTSSVYCPNLSITMQKCDPDRPLSQQRCTDATTQGQVTELQRFLSDYYDLNPDDYVTGYFGRLTRDNVRRFQCESMSICSDDESTTGWGVVGPRTRAAIAEVCDSRADDDDTAYSCLTPWGSTLPHGQNVTAYQSFSVPAGQQCTFETRYCTNGTLSGTYQYATCSVATATCTPEAPQTQTLSCPQGQTGSITQTRTSTCPGPTWGAWTTTSNTCTNANANTTQSCTLDGVTVEHGATRKFYLLKTGLTEPLCQVLSLDRQCTNGTLSGSGLYQYATCTEAGAGWPPPTDQNVSCTTPWGQTVEHGQSVDAYQSPLVLTGQQCTKEVRSCGNGVLSGSYQFQSCAPIPPIPPPPPPPLSPLTVSLTINNQSAVTLPPGTTFTVAWSSSNATSCNLTNAQNQTNPTPPNVSGSSQGAAPAAGQTYTYTLSCTNAGGTTTRTATVTGSTGGTGGATLTATPSSGTAPLTVTFDGVVPAAINNLEYIDFGDGSSPVHGPITAVCNNGLCPVPFGQHVYRSAGTFAAKITYNGTTYATATITVAGTTASNVGSCTYKGQTYAEGVTATIPNPNYPGNNVSLTCDNATWVYKYDNVDGVDACNILGPDLGTNCSRSMSSAAVFGVVPRHGRAPLTVSTNTQSPRCVGVPGVGDVCDPYTLSWGDGTVENYPQTSHPFTPQRNISTHTYTSIGSYTIDYQGATLSYPARIRVVGPTASTQNSSQLANALTALENALKAILEFLK